MNDEELRIKVAELCGWTDIGERFIAHGDKQINRLCGKFKREHCDHQIPRYHNDLNAMHTAEMSLSSYDYSEFCRQVTFIVVAKKGFAYADYTQSATARQRAQAFVATMENAEERMKLRDARRDA